MPVQGNFLSFWDIFPAISIEENLRNILGNSDIC